MDPSEQPRRRLGKRLSRLDASLLEPPERGWIHGIRKAIGMSNFELAQRMRVREPSLYSAMRNEARSTIKLNTLRHAAEAMNCELVYAFVPRTSFDQNMRDRSVEKAHLNVVKEGLDEQEIAKQIDELAKKFLPRRDLWNDYPLKRAKRT